MRLAKNLVIVGVGLIGGSIGLAAKKRGLAEKVIGVCRSEESMQAALRYDAVDQATQNLADASSQADLLILATPVASVVPLARRVARHISPECTVTDVASTKASIVQECEKLFDGNYVGSHPMAGSEKSGIKYAKENLFENTVSILTPTIKTNIKSSRKVYSFWEQLGARVKTLKPQEHDAVTAAISHFPHLLAYLLVLSLHHSKMPVHEMLSFSAGGFKDMTRIAASPAALWSEIFFENKEEVLRCLKDFSGLLKNWESLLRADKKKKVAELLGQAQKIRERLG